MQKIFQAGVMATALAATLGAAGEISGWNFHSTSAKEAKRKYEASVARAEGAYAEAKQAAATVAVKELTVSMNVATRAADLDEATKIKAAITELKSFDKQAVHSHSNEFQARAALATGLIGTKWKRSDTPDTRTFLADGTIVCDPAANGRWTPISDHAVLIMYDSGWVDLFEFDNKLSSYKATNGHLQNRWDGIRLDDH